MQGWCKHETNDLKNAQFTYNSHINLTKGIHATTRHEQLFILTAQRYKMQYVKKHLHRNKMIFVVCFFFSTIINRYVEKWPILAGDIIKKFHRW